MIVLEREPLYLIRQGGLYDAVEQEKESDSVCVCGTSF